MKTSHICLLLWFLSFFLLPLSAQIEGLHLENLSVDQGSSDRTVYCILQDYKGFMWFGTKNGLNRYDGYRFKVYQNNPNDSLSLSSNAIYVLHEDALNVLWVGTLGGGLNQFDRETETFTRYQHDPGNPKSLSHNIVWSICEEDSAHLWIGTYKGGLNKFNRHTKTFLHFKHDPENPNRLSHNDISALHKDAFNQLWIGTQGGGLNRFNLAEDSFTHFKHHSADPNSLSSNIVTSILEDQSKRLWIATWIGGLNKFDRETGLFTRYPYQSTEPDNRNFPGFIHKGQSKRLWIGNRMGGLVQFNLETETFTYYQHDRLNPNYLTAAVIYQVYEDQSEVLWVGTDDKGLNKIDLKKQAFVYYQHDPKNEHSLSSNNVKVIYQDRDGIVWIGTDNGLNRLNLKDQTIIRYQYDSKNKNSLSSNYIISIYQEDSGILWIGTRDKGLNRFDPETETFTHYKHNPADSYSLSNNLVTRILEDHSGQLWLGTWGGGLNRLDQKQRRFIRYQHDPADPKSLSDNIVTDIYEDRSGQLWIGTREGGLNKLDPKQQHFIRYQRDLNELDEHRDRVHCIYEDQAGTLWFTGEAALWKLEQAAEKGVFYKQQEGSFVQILEGENGHLWLSSSYGFFSFDSMNDTLTNYYGIRNGLLSGRLNYYGFYRGQQGEIFCGTTKGLNIFDPDRLKANPCIPPLAITAVKSFDRVIESDVSDTTSIELSYQDKYLNFEFAALDYSDSKKNRYTYQLEGFDEDWIETDGHRPMATYTNLDPGRYTFRVKGSNNDGLWSKKVPAVHLFIHPPWWQSSWAYVLYLIIISAVIYAFINYRLSRERLLYNLNLERLEKEKIQEISQVRSQFFTNISHEFRTPITLILGPLEKFFADAYIVKKQSRNLQLIDRNARRLLRMTDQLLDFHKIESGQLELNMSRGDIIAFIKEIAIAFQEKAADQQIIFQYHSESAHLETRFDADKLEKMLYNLLFNAFKFTPKQGSIAIHVAPVPAADEAVADLSTDDTVPVSNYLKIAVQDSGIGIPADQQTRIFERFYQVDGSHTRPYEGSGIGLALVAALIQCYQGKITLDSQVGQGSTFTLYLPLFGSMSSEAGNLDDGKIDSRVRPSRLSAASDEMIIPAEDHDHSDPKLPLVLVVEDNPDVRQFIRNELRQHYRVMEADDGKQGLEMAVSQIPDIIISDIMMPRMDGMTLCKHLKTHQCTSHIPVILLTARAGEANEIAGLETGADDYIVKPFRTRILQARVHSLLVSRKQLREQFRREGLSKVDREALTTPDQRFIERLQSVLNAHLSNPSFDIEQFVREMHLSRMQLFRKVKALTEHTPTELIRENRLQQAAQLLMQHPQILISEIAEMVGFKDIYAFSKSFRKRFGKSPRQFREAAHF